MTYASKQCAQNAIKSMHHSQTMEVCIFIITFKNASWNKDSIMTISQGIRKFACHTVPITVLESLMLCVGCPQKANILIDYLCSGLCLIGQFWKVILGNMHFWNITIWFPLHFFCFSAYDALDISCTQGTISLLFLMQMIPGHKTYHLTAQVISWHPNKFPVLLEFSFPS